MKKDQVSAKAKASKSPAKAKTASKAKTANKSKATTGGSVKKSQAAKTNTKAKASKSPAKAKTASKAKAASSTKGIRGSGKSKSKLFSTKNMVIAGVASVLIVLGGSFAYGKISESNAAFTKGYGCNSPQQLRNGSKGNCVKLAQSKLKMWSQCMKRRSVAVDGKFGPETYTEVKAFQSANGLQVDGIVGPATWSKLSKVQGSVCFVVKDTKFNNKQSQKQADTKAAAAKKAAAKKAAEKKAAEKKAAAKKAAEKKAAKKKADELKKNIKATIGNGPKYGDKRTVVKQKNGRQQRCTEVYTRFSQGGGRWIEKPGTCSRI